MLTRRCLPWFVGLLLFLHRAIVLCAEEPPVPWQLVRQIVVDEEAWHWNSASWDQEKIASFGDFQYTVYWDSLFDADENTPGPARGQGCLGQSL